MSFCAVRRTSASLALALVLSGCGYLLPYSQGGSREDAIRAADVFLTSLVHLDSDAAWAHLTPQTRGVIYRDDQSAFARDVEAADWSRMTWRFGPVTDLDISWGVHVMVGDNAVPEFLIERGIVGGGAGFGIVILVQTPNRKPYLIAAQGLDERL